MIVCRTIEEFRAERSQIAGALGLVPTMGFLHRGHLALIDQSIAENDFTAVTIFVNPAQFNVPEDLAAYPHDEPGDLRLLQEAGVDIVLIPSPDEIYPEGFQTYITVERLSAPLEGASRPGHFRGVATVVAKFFNIIQPDRAYFGQKDAQQVAVIKQMACDLNFPIQIKIHPIIRESDGLAMSSRNARLSNKERHAATVLHKALMTANDKFEEGLHDPKALRELMNRVLESEPLAAIDYVSIADAHTLEELHAPLPPTRPVLISLAVFIGKIRLIDNLVLNG